MTEQNAPRSVAVDTLPAEEPDLLELDGSWEAVNQYFFERNWTDGLPIVPPTEERVDAMLAFARERLGYEADDVVGILQPKNGVATVAKIAANAVMAGARVEYMPVLMAVTRAIAEPRYNLFGVQTSTHNTSVLAVVNGPMRESLDINWGYNVVGSRWHSTATLGRALRFIVTNIGGLPGATNIHTQGHIARYEHMIAENEAENPWEPLHVERGFEAQESTVTVFAACPAMMIDENSGSRSAKELLMTFARSVPYVGNRNINGEGEPLIVLGPQHANLLAKEGYSKRDFKRFMWEHARVPFSHIPTGNLQSYSDRFRKFYVDVSPDTGVPIADRPEDIAVIVMGGKGTHSLSVQTLLGSRSQTVLIARKDGAAYSG
jgi:hypothetical protein